MCGRFTLRKDSDALAAHFEVEDVHPIAPRFNIAPSQTIPVVRFQPSAGRRELALMRWGLDPPWAPRAGAPLSLINARAETLAARPAFRDAFRRRRCLIPADGFYEWQKIEGAKRPWFLHLKGDRLFAFAGLWGSVDGGDGDEPRDSCTIITTTPLPLIAPIHDRMPAIQNPRDYGVWLDPAITDAAVLARLLQPERALELRAELEAYPVRKTVNWAENDTAACVERA